MMKRKGLTLIELLISLVVLSLMSLLFVQAFFFAREALEKEYSLVPEHYVAAMKLVYLINSIYPYVVKSGNKFYFYFTGKENSLSFVSQYNFLEGKRGDGLFLYKISSGKKITIEQIRVFPNKGVDPVTLQVFENSPENSKKTELPFEKLNFLFFSSGGEWKKEIRNVIPRFVKVYLRYKSGTLEFLIGINSKDESKIRLTQFLYLQSIR